MTPLNSHPRKFLGIAQTKKFCVYDRNFSYGVNKGWKGWKFGNTKVNKFGNAKVGKKFGKSFSKFTFPIFHDPPQPSF